MTRLPQFKALAAVVLAAALCACSGEPGSAGPAGAAATVTLVVAGDAAPRVVYGADRLAAALEENGYDVVRSSVPDGGTEGRRILVGNARNDPALAGLLEGHPAADAPGGIDSLGEEGFLVASVDVASIDAADAGGPGGTLVVAGADDSGALYGSLELAGRVRAAGALPESITLRETPDFRLRGPSIGMQQLELLPGREIYDYPYTPELFPFFYDKAHWRDYLDMLVTNRMNTLYLWNGHPFASLVKLEKYPYAVEVSDEVFARNVEMFDYITREADRRGIWVIQMFYNIYVSKPFAEHHGIGTIHAEPDPLTSDYNRLSIAKFVEQYPNVGLLVCLGEALVGQENQQQWLNEVVIPGVKLGLKRQDKSRLDQSRLGATAEPPIVIRAHAVADPHSLIQGALPHYGNLYTMAKYNGESLTTHEPRGKWVDIHNALSETGGTHVANVHILANLEPFRYGATEFIRKSMLAIRDVDRAQGLHLYPLSFWDWPVSPDAADPPLRQIERDWIWYEAWARYAWDADRDPAEERDYWIGRLAGVYGSEAAARHIFDAYNAAGEVAPRLLRWFGITEGNRQTLSLGMTLDQLVDPYAYTTYPELWESHAPPGERLDTYLEREQAGEAHVGETPPAVIAAAERFAADAAAAIEAAAPHVTENEAEFARLQNDVYAIRAMAQFYADKVRAAMAVMRYEYSGNAADMDDALAALEASVAHYRELEVLTRDSYRYANSLQTGHRKIPTRGADAEGRGRDYHWTQLLPAYEDELERFREQVAALQPPDAGAAAGSD